MLFRPSPLRVPFSLEFLQIRPILRPRLKEREGERERERERGDSRSPIAESPFCISPPRKRGTREDHVVAVRLESGIYCQLNGPVPRPPYPERSF